MASGLSGLAATANQKAAIKSWEYKSDMVLMEGVVDIRLGPLGFKPRLLRLTKEEVFFFKEDDKPAGFIGIDRNTTITRDIAEAGVSKPNYWMVASSGTNWLMRGVDDAVKERWSTALESIINNKSISSSILQQQQQFNQHYNLDTVDTSNAPAGTSWLEKQSRPVPVAEVGTNVTQAAPTITVNAKATAAALKLAPFKPPPMDPDNESQQPYSAPPPRVVVKPAARPSPAAAPVSAPNPATSKSKPPPPRRNQPAYDSGGYDNNYDNSDNNYDNSYDSSSYDGSNNDELASQIKTAEDRIAELEEMIAQEQQAKQKAEKRAEQLEKEIAAASKSSNATSSPTPQPAKPSAPLQKNTPQMTVTTSPKAAPQTNISPKATPQTNISPKIAPQTTITPKIAPQPTITSKIAPQTTTSPKIAPPTNISPKTAPQTTTTSKVAPQQSTPKLAAATTLAPKSAPHQRTSTPINTAALTTPKLAAQVRTSTPSAITQKMYKEPEPEPEPEVTPDEEYYDPSYHEPLPIHARALYDYHRQAAGDIEFKAGDIITVLEQGDEHWWTGEVNGQQGSFPTNYVEML